MNARKFKGQKILAMAVVAMFAFCAFSVCFTDNESDAGYDATFKIDMAGGSQFSYTPTFNMTSGAITVDATGDAMKSSGGPLDITGAQGTAGVSPNRTIAGTFGAGTPEGAVTSTTITATWTSPTDATLTQTATQTIQFTTYTKVSLPSTISEGKLNLIQGDYQTVGATVATINAVGPTTVTTSGNFTDGPLEVTHANGVATVKIKTKLTADDAGEYTVTIHADDGNDKYIDTADQSYKFTIFQDLSISVTPEQKDTYIGKGDTPTFTFTVPNTPAGATVTFSDNGSAFGTGVTGSMTDDGVYTVNLSAATNDLITTGDVVEYTIKAKAHIVYAGDAGAKDITKNATLRIYKAFEFTKEPALKNSTVYYASGNPLDVLMSADFEGTTKISYNWGDGKSTVVETNPDSGSKYSARHVYANEGVYVITVTAYNSSGTTTAYTLYDAKNAFFEDITGDTNGGDNSDTDNKDDTPAEESFFDKHGYQFIIFAVIAILAFVAFFFFGIQNPVVLIAGIITALLAVLCFVYNDIGGLIEELKALLKL